MTKLLRSLCALVLLLASPLFAANNQFVDNGDGTISDLNRGLMWTSATLGHMEFDSASATCSHLILNNDAQWTSGTANHTGALYDDWRLPTLQELESLVDLNFAPVVIDPSFFPDTQPDIYWSSEPHMMWAWTVHFGSGGSEYYGQGAPFYFRAVRGTTGCNLMGDTDLDTVCDDGDGSGVAGDATCSGGNVQLCDDNCPGVVNPSQSDSDGDGVGDLCDLCDVCVVPDTNQTTSFTDIFGEDSDYTGRPHSFTKLGSGGVELAQTASSWLMVKDNVTGLIWEAKTDDGSIHDKDNTYSVAAAQQVFIAGLNSESFGGFDDWRLPTMQEIAFLADKEIFEPAIDQTYFPNTVFWEMGPYYWSSADGWSISFYRARVNGYNVAAGMPVRAVRGPISDFGNFVAHDASTVIAQRSGLMWQKAGPAAGYTWEGALTYCESLELSGFDDWRLPNYNELQSLVQYHYTERPRFDATHFPDMRASDYWSSTSAAFAATEAWYVNFDFGMIYPGSKTGEHYVMAVRNVGTCGALGDTDGDTICDDGDGSGLVGDNHCTAGQVSNCDDNCLAVSNSDQLDDDGDGVGNACEVVDAGVPDAQRDAWSPDAWSPDAWSPDGLSPDVLSPDILALDTFAAADTGGVVGDGAVADAGGLDVTVLDSGPADRATPDVAADDIMAPVDSAVPDTVVLADAAVADRVSVDLLGLELVAADTRGGVVTGDAADADTTVGEGCNCRAGLQPTAATAGQQLLVVLLMGMVLVRRRIVR